MSITERQNKILDAIIWEYIESAKPVSSQWLERKYDFGIRPAMLRIEMQKLTDEGYLSQPHISAGRVPTDKGYRFFVDEILEDEPEDFDIENLLSGDIDDSVKFLQVLTRNLAAASEALVLSYLEKEKIFWKEGWEELLREPEFAQKEYIVKFTKFLAEFEKSIADLKLNSEIKIYIGRENPLKGASEFSMIISRCELPTDGQGVISILGPKRMDYDRNIGLMNSLLWQKKKNQTLKT